MTFPQRRNTISPKQVKRHTQPLRGCLKSLHGFLQRYPHAMVIVDFRELRTIVTSSEAALHQLKTLMSGLFKQPLSVAISIRPKILTHACLTLWRSTTLIMPIRIVGRIRDNP